MSTDLETVDAVEIDRPPAYNPLALLDKAIERGVDADQLGKLMGLAERWKATVAKESFERDMNAAQKAMPTVVRDADNQKTRSKYARLETIEQTCKPIWTDHGFRLSWTEEDCPREGWMRIVCILGHVSGHEERYRRDLPYDGIGPKGNPIGGMNAVQAVGSTSHYGRRYIICDVFNITVAGADKDGNSRTPEVVTIAPQQVEEINKLLVATGTSGQKFAEWLRVPSIDQIAQADFQETVRVLKRKAARMASEKAAKGAK